MDEYAREIEELQARHDALIEAEGDADTIRDLSMQIEVLGALYAQAGELWARGRGNPAMRAALTIRGFGEWTLDSVYAFVYESSAELPEKGHRDFLEGIREADFAAQLVAAGAEAGPADRA